MEEEIVKLKNPVLVLIVTLAFVLRFAFVTYNPPSLNWDEVSHGYNAYSILKTGKDEWGSFLPIANFRAYGDYPLPLNLYLTIPFVAALGLNEFAIRLPHVILGALTVAASCFLAWGITKNRRVSLLTGFLTAVVPWNLFTSRFVAQSNLAVFFLTAGMAAFFNRGRNKYLLPASFLFLGLTLYSYHTTRIFTPLLVLGMFLVYKRELVKQLRPVTFVLLALFFLPLPFILANQQARARSQMVFVVDEGAINKIIENRQKSTFPKPIVRLVYNRPVYFVSHFIVNYLGYFSPDFLFIRGGTQYQFSVPNQGLLNLLDLPFFYLGLLVLLNKVRKKDRDYTVLFLWLILAPVPAAITSEVSAVLRSSAMLPIPQILIALGLVQALNFVRKKRNYVPIAVGLYFVLVAFFMEGYVASYFTSYRTDYSWAWQYGYKEAVGYAKQNYDKYDKIIVTKKYGEPHEFFLFYWPWEPDRYMKDANLVRFSQSNWYWVDRFDKFYFVNDWQVKDLVTESKIKIDCNHQKCLLITSPDNFPKSWKKLEAVNFLDGKPAFEIYEN